MKKLIMVCLLILILALPLFLTSCVEDTGAADIEVAQNTKITALEAWKNTIESVTGGLQNFLTNLKVQVDKKANQDDLTALKSRVDSLNTSSGFNSANYYLKTEIDPKITDLQTQINALKTTTPGGGTTLPTTNNIAVKNYSMTPSMIYGSGHYDLFVEVKNGYADSKKIVLTATLVPDQANVRVKSSGTMFSSDSSYVTGTSPRMATNVSAGNCTDLTNLIMGTTNQVFIGGNTTILIPIKFDLTYCGVGDPSGASNPAIWTPTWSVTIIP